MSSFAKRSILPFMKKYILLFALSLVNTPTFAEPQPIIELFTSFNCPACPAADNYAKAMQDNNEALILSYHVDYWNNDTFTDPYSHFDFTQRQYDYSNVIGARPGRVFTPQMIVDGMAEVKPPFAARMPIALKQAAEKEKKHIRIAKLGESLRLDFPRHEGFEFPILWVVGYNNSKITTLTEGTHKGRKAVTVNTVMYLAELPYTGETNILLSRYQIPQTDNLAVFLQEAGPGRIIALGTHALR